MMKLKKYISKNFIVRVCLLFAIVGGAAVFDMYHTASQQLTNPVRKTPVSDEGDSGKAFFCNQVTIYNLKTSATEFSVRFRFASTQDKFLIQHYNLRTFQLMKAEAFHSGFSSVCPFHSLPFLRVLYASPDDTPPLT